MRCVSRSYFLGQTHVMVCGGLDSKSCYKNNIILTHPTSNSLDQDSSRLMSTTTTTTTTEKAKKKNTTKQ